MTTELDALAKKNTQQTNEALRKKKKIKLHNIKAAGKAHSADPDREPGLFGYGKKPTEKSKSLDKEYRKTKKSLDRLEKRDDKLHEHGVWSKDNKKGEAFASLEKDKLIKKGFPSKAKMAGGGRARLSVGGAAKRGISKILRKC
jgi:hypothetical protein